MDALPKITAIKNWSADDRPREKLLQHGVSVLSNAELLAVLIGSGTKNISAVEVCKAILKEHENNLDALGKLNVKELMRFKGIGEAKAISIIAALELGRRRVWKSDEMPKITSSNAAAEIAFALVNDINREEFWLFILNNALKLVRKIQISSGGINQTVVDVRLIFKHALENNATSIIVVHNHPSGNINPSEADKKITEQIKQAGNIMQIKLQDHIIIASGNYFSFADNGIL